MMKQSMVMASFLATMMLAASAGAAIGQTTVNPILWYRFNGDLNNSGSLTDSKYSGIGNLFQDGSAGQADFGKGVYGSDNCFVLTNGDINANGDRIVIPFNLSSLTSGSMSFWLKEDEAYNYNTVFSCSANQSDWEMFSYDSAENASDKYQVRLDSGVVSTNPSRYMDGFGSWWNHYTYTWDYHADTGQADMKLYLNGKLGQYYVSTATSSWASSGDYFYLGGGPNNHTATSGTGNDYGTWSMDDFRVYDTTLSDSDAYNVYLERNNAIYQNAFASSSQAVVRYEFKDDGSDIDLSIQPNVVLNSGSYAPEFQGELYNGGGEGNIGFVNDPERGKVLKIEQVANSDNRYNSYHLESSYTLGGNGVENSIDEGTISFWLKVTEFNELGTIFDSPDGRNWEAYVFDDGNFRFAVGDDSYTTVQLDDYGDGKEDWHHVSLRWLRGGEGEEWRVALWCFIDGEEADYDEGSWSYGDGGTDGIMGIGGLSDLNPGGNFLMDNFSIFETALDDDAIKAIYDAEKVEWIPGDANKDGKVDGSDVTILANNWQKGVDGNSTASWGEGDFNGDGKVDGSDVTILANNWQQGVNTGTAAVPEPSTMVLLIGALACMGLFLHRR